MIFSRELIYEVDFKIQINQILFSFIFLKKWKTKSLNLYLDIGILVVVLNQFVIYLLIQELNGKIKYIFNLVKKNGSKKINTS